MKYSNPTLYYIWRDNKVRFRLYIRSVGIDTGVVLLVRTRVRVSSFSDRVKAHSTVVMHPVPEGLCQLALIC